MWYEQAVFYQIYPLGFCGAPAENDGISVNRIAKVRGWIPHLEKLHVGAVYFSPVFESDRHGYDTRDFAKIDCRLGTNEDFAAVCGALHAAGIRVVLDGVFHHVGRGFWAFQDVLQNREDSPYKDWFYFDFHGDSNYHDGLWYEGWEGHYELVKLNLGNPAVVDHLLDAVGKHMEDFGIDGLRLDVAYSLPEDFLRRLNGFCKGKREDFFLLGEMIHGDYKRIVGDGLLDSATNYECYKGLYSSFNTVNLFEISYSLNRQFGPEDWTLYKGMNLTNFADNHDVSRIYSILEEKEHLKPLYAALFAMPGIACLYYGSEWGAEGDKGRGDDDLRPCFDEPVENELFRYVSKLCAIRKASPALMHGDFQNETVKNGQWTFLRRAKEETLLIAINAEKTEAVVECRFHGTATDLMTGGDETLRGSIRLMPFEARLLRLHQEG